MASKSYSISSHLNLRHCLSRTLSVSVSLSFHGASSSSSSSPDLPQGNRRRSVSLVSLSHLLVALSHLSTDRPRESQSFSVAILVAGQPLEVGIQRRVCHCQHRFALLLPRLSSKAGKERRGRLRTTFISRLSCLVLSWLGSLCWLHLPMIHSPRSDNLSPLCEPICASERSDKSSAEPEETPSRSIVQATVGGLLISMARANATMTVLSGDPCLG
jgi:hypothetical protein